MPPRGALINERIRPTARRRETPACRNLRRGVTIYFSLLCRRLRNGLSPGLFVRVGCREARLQLLTVPCCGRWPGSII